MSSAAKWSYTAPITIWPFVSIDDWTGSVVYGAPVTFMGDPSAKVERLVGADGNDFVSSQSVFTEYGLARAKDMLFIGTSTNPDPVAAGAKQIKLVMDYGDTLERKAPDYRLVT